MDIEKALITASLSLFLPIVAFFLAAFGAGWLASTHVKNIARDSAETIVNNHRLEIAKDIATIKSSGDVLDTLKKEFDSLRKIAAERAVALTSLTLSNLPKVTFTQQIPISFIRTIGYVIPRPLGEAPGDVSSFIKIAPASDDVILKDVAPDLQGWLLYGVAVRNLALNAEDRIALREAEGSVLDMLEKAFQAFAGDPLTQRDIMLRRAQALRQLEEFDQAGETLRSALNAFSKDKHSNILVSWAQSVLGIQEALNRYSQHDAAFSQNIESSYNILYDQFKDLFGLTQAQGARRNVSEYDDRYSLGSVAYYFAKISWICMNAQGNGTISRNIVSSNTLHEALDVAFDQYERKRLVVDDLTVLAIYNFCVAFIIAMRRQYCLFEFHSGRRLELQYKDLHGSEDAWNEHFDSCINEARNILNQIGLRNRGSKDYDILYIYSETRERLAGIEVFRSDVDMLLNARDSPADLYRQMLDRAKNEQIRRD